MKPILIAAALLLLPAAAQAQVSAGSMPNSFDPPAGAARAAPAPVVPVAAPTPANARSEDVLRDFIAGAQAGTINYSGMTEDVATRLRAQEAVNLPLITGFGLVRAVDFLTNQNGLDVFAVTFANAATEWAIGFDETDKVAVLLFRPAQ